MWQDRKYTQLVLFASEDLVPSQHITEPSRHDKGGIARVLGKQTTSFLVTFYILFVKRVSPFTVMLDPQFPDLTGDRIRTPIAFQELHKSKLDRVDYDAERYPQRKQHENASYADTNKSIQGSRPVRAVTPSAATDQDVDVHDEE